MFGATFSEIANRRLSAQRLVSLIDALEGASDLATASVCKGLAFVHFYAVYEYAVRSSVQAALAELRSAGLEFRRLRRDLLALILEPQWESASKSARGRMWESRIALVTHVDSLALTSNLRDDFFPSDGSHYRANQLRTIWRIFTITEPIVPAPRYLSRIEELVENRNGISHGRLTAEEVGRRYSRQDIAERVNDVYEISNHIVRVLEAHVRGGGCLAAAGGP
jgi:hypothetical protein